MQERFRKNEKFLKTGNIDSPLPFPKNLEENYPYQLREIFEYFQAIIKRRELLAFCNGTLFSEKIINMYFKVLEKMNLVQLSMDNF